MAVSPRWTPLVKPLLRRPQGTLSQQAVLGSVLLCVTHILMNMAGPILLSWVKRQQGGRYGFSAAAMTFHAYAIAVMLGVAWASLSGAEGLKRLNRPDMLWRFCVCASLMAVADILSFMSMQHLDTGTYSLVGKSFTLIATVGLARVILGRRQEIFQYGLVLGAVSATIAFCYMETGLRSSVSKHAGFAAEEAVHASQGWSLGLTERTAAVLLSSVAAVFQESLFAHGPCMPYMLQQCWMGCGATATSFAIFRYVHGLSFSDLFMGFDDWKVLLVLIVYVANGLTAGLVVKRLGAITKALCVPIHLGGCYLFAVLEGSVPLSVGVVAAWTVSTSFILTFAFSRALGSTRVSFSLPRVVQQTKNLPAS